MDVMIVCKWKSYKSKFALLEDTRTRRHTMSVNALPPSQICGMMENRSAATIVHYGTTTKTNNGSDEHIGVVKTLDVLQPDELDEVRSARFSYVHQVSIPRLQWHKQHQPEQAQSTGKTTISKAHTPPRLYRPGLTMMMTIGTVIHFPSMWILQAKKICTHSATVKYDGCVTAAMSVTSVD